PQYRRIIELFWFRPHMTVDLVDIALEHAELLRCNGASHDGQSIYREERVLPKARDPMALDKARCLKALVVRLVLDTDEALRRRPVAGQLVNAAQQHRRIFEFRTGPLLDFRDHQMRQIGVGAAEIEMEFELCHGVTISPQKAGFRARMT